VEFRVPRPWRIITFGRHSTVWDGGDLIFDFNYQAFGVDPNECFDNAFDKELPPGKYRPVYFAEHYTGEQSRHMADLTKRLQDLTPTSDSLNSKTDTARLTLPRPIQSDFDT
jgi:hypothetical protein